MDRSLRLGAKTVELIGALFKGREWLSFLRAPATPSIELMRQIAACGELGAAPYLLAYATTATVSETETAENAVAALLFPFADEKLIYIDQSFRSSRLYMPNIPGWNEWLRLEPVQLDAIARRNDHAVALFGLASFHYSGRVREKAVRLLGLCNGSAELPFLFLRLNDWVDIVASLAAVEIRKRLVPEMAGAFARHIVFIQRLKAWGRVDHSATSNAIITFLAQPGCRAQLAAALESADPQSRKLIYEILAQSNDESAQHAILQALSDHAPPVRLWAMRGARGLLQGEQLAKAIDQSLNDRSSAVCTAAAYALIDSFPEKLLTHLPPLLMASSPTLRAIARFHLAKISDIDLRAFYTAQLASKGNRDVEIVVLSLGDLGNKDDVPLLRKYLQDPRPSVCAAAIRGLARICGDDLVAEFTAILLSRNGLVAKQAMQALSKRSSLVDQRTVWARFLQPDEATQRARYLRLLAGTNKWDALYFIMAARRDSDSIIVALADDFLKKWEQLFNSSASTPSPQQKLRVQEAMTAFSEGIDEQRLKRLQFLTR